MAQRMSRPRFLAVFALVVLSIVTTIGAGIFAALPSAAITEPTNDDPGYSGPQLVMDALGASVGTVTVNVTGMADASDEVTVEVIPPTSAPYTCVVNADSGTGAWGCTIAFAEAGEYEIQAYRFGGLFTDHFDSTSIVYTGSASFDAEGDLYWNGWMGGITVNGTRNVASDAQLLLDGAPLCTMPAGETTWSCYTDAVPSEGTHTLTIVASSAGFSQPNPPSITLIVDTVAPGMATFDYPFELSSAPAPIPAAIPYFYSSDGGLWFEGPGTPGDRVYVVYNDGATRDMDWDYLNYPICSATVDEWGYWWCGTEGDFATGSIMRFGSYQMDPAGNQTDIDVMHEQFIVEIVDGPVTPTIASPANSATVVGTSVTITGTGTYPDGIALFQEHSEDAYTYYCGGEGWYFYTANGQWACTIDSLGYGTHTLYAAAVDDIGDGFYEWSDETSVTFTLVAPPVPPTPVSNPDPTPTPTPEPYQWAFVLTDQDGNPVDPTNIAPGTRVVITATGLPPGAVVSAELHSDPIALGSTTVGEDGVLRLPVLVPMNVPPGDHELVVTLDPPEGEPSTLSAPVKVAAVAEQPVAEEPVAEDSVDAPTGSVDRAPASGPDFSEPSSLATALQTFDQVRITPVTVAVAGAMSLALIVLVALPAEILQSTITANYQRAFGWLTPIAHRGRRWRDRLPAWLRGGRLSGALTVAVAALILGFSDPTFGFSGSSFRLWLALFTSLFLVNVVILGVARSIAKRRYTVQSFLDPMPGALLIVALSVLVSRIASIEPGFLFGLVVGVVFLRELSKAQEGRLALVGVGLAIVMGVASWLVFSTLPAEGGAWVQFARDFTAATTLEALSTMLIVLLPLSYFDGHLLFVWSKWVWALTYIASVIAFVVVVLPMSDSWGEMSAPLFGWVTLFAVFAVIATAVWAAFKFIPERRSVTQELESSNQH